jgi:uncharacterized membrane protein (UPF0127 family)
MLTRINGKKKEIICSKTVLRTSVFSRGTGLMFHSRIHDEAHVFLFEKPRKVALTMMFVFFPIDVLYLDKNRRIVEIKEDFRPFAEYHPEKESAYVIELPAGTVKAKKLKINNSMQF